MLFATGGADTSIKLFEVLNFFHFHCPDPTFFYYASSRIDSSVDIPCCFFEVPKVKQMLSGDTQARPLIRTFYDHAEVSLFFIFHIFCHFLFSFLVSLILMTIIFSQ